MNTTNITAITAESLRKRFHVKGGEPVLAVDDVSFRINPGEIVALLGPNGAGKTTTIDMLLGLTAPESGRCTLYGMAPKKAINRGLIGVIQQTGSLINEWTVGQLLSYIASTYAVPRPVEEVMAETDLTKLARRRIGKCSGGQIQRLRLAIALIPDPLLLILDEPTAGMDVNARRKFWALMREQANAGRTIVFATHYLTEAEEFAERTIIMAEGSIVADESTATLRARTLKQHLTANIAPAQLDTLLQQLRKLRIGTDWHLDVIGHRVKLEGTALEPAALAILSAPGTSGFEMTSATLEDTFRALTDDNSNTSQNSQNLEV
ncbi:ABC transporter ATP-binding protein [Micrococcoides hystricis]|uniref:ABC transporter ATP-binding protein n=1 Tax=Micrococcoides hystricis TaxID=1572761 RepID=A0ABV6PD63_9MICC